MSNEFTSHQNFQGFSFKKRDKSQETEINSAIFIDWDNIYLSLLGKSQILATAFLENSEQWMKWIEGHFLKILYGENFNRQLLVRNAYYNPNTFFSHVPAMLKAGITPIACPPLTEKGKTTADAKLIIDAMKLLHKPFPNFQEFIIVSGDTDFTPLLIELREQGKKGLILAVGPTSQAYSSSAFWKIREDWFCEQAILGRDRRIYNSQEDWSLSFINN